MKLLENLRNDLPASLVVFFVAVPLCLGIALASGAPAMSGLIAGIVGGIVVGTLSGSALGVSGPAAGLAVIVLQAIDKHGFEIFLVAVVLAGVIQLVMGALRAGALSYLFPSPVIRGMLAGIGIIIFIKQIPYALGLDKGEKLDFANLGDQITMNALLVAVASLVILIVWEQVLAKKAAIFRLIQGPLVVVALGILYEVISRSVAPGLAFQPQHLVDVPVAGSLSEFGEQLTSPQWSAWTDTTVWVTAATLALVGSLETLLCLDATDKLDPLERVTPPNRELFAQGVGNMISGAIGGLPITQVIVRSSANINSGGRTKLSAILHGVLMLGFVALLPQVLNLIPLSVLAAILFIVGYKLATPALFRSMWAQGLGHFIAFVVTIAGIVYLDLLKGIGIGFVVALCVPDIRRQLLGNLRSKGQEPA